MLAPATAPPTTAGPRRTAPPAHAAYPRPASAPPTGHAAVFHTAATAPANFPHFASLPCPSACPPAAAS